MLSLASFGAGSGSYIPKLAGTATKLGVGEQRTRGFGVTSLPVVRHDADCPVQCKWNGNRLNIAYNLFLKAYFIYSSPHGQPSDYVAQAHGSGSARLSYSRTK